MSNCRRCEKCDFCPFANIGLIVLDEEHTETYKQDTLPFYHARDIAIMRAKYHGAKVLLGSATPSWNHVLADLRFIICST